MAYGFASEARSCPSCGNGALRRLDIFTGKKPVERGKFVWFITGCKSCGLIFADPPPAHEEIAALYAQGGEWRDRIARQDAETDPTREAVRAARNAAVADFLIKRVVPLGLRRALDFGCGRGPILDALKAVGW